MGVEEVAGIEDAVSEEEATCEGVVCVEVGSNIGGRGVGLAEWLGFFADPVFP